VDFTIYFVALLLTELVCFRHCHMKISDKFVCCRSPLLQALIGLFELPEDDSTLPDDHYIEVEETPGYQPAYSQLAFANKKDRDPLHGIVSYHTVGSCLILLRCNGLMSYLCSYKITHTS
jgi:hypothetical protein